jgi:serine/threonine protein kinase
MAADATICEHSAGAETALAELVDDLLSRLRAGESLDADQILAEHAQFASRLRDILPGLRAMCELTTDKDVRRSEIAGDDAANDVLAGVLGDFRILREIGRGGMGIVYEAIQTSLNRRVALKVLPLAAMLDPRHLQRFKNEAMAAASLDHPNIVEVHAVGCERGVHFYAMRYIEGQTLAAVIDGLKCGARSAECGVTSTSPNDDSAETPNSELRTSHSQDTAAINALSTLRTTRPKDFYRLVAELGIQAAEALEHAHQMGIVHRDIKPSNLMLEVRSAECGVRNEKNSELRIPNSQLWITDFGLARIESDATLTMTGDLLGTLRYMSPEQAEGKSAILDHRTDIYSLGITLYELLTLRPAFPADDRQTLLRQIANDEPLLPRKLNSAIPADLETIILKSIAKDPRDRYPSARNLADDFRHYLSQQPLNARRPTLLNRSRRWAARHFALLSAAMVMLSLIAASGIAATVLIARAYKSESDQRTEAEINLRLAQENLQLAADAVESLMVRLVSEPEYAHGNVHAVERLISDAMEFHDRLLSQSDDPKLLKTAGLSCGHAIFIRLTAGLPDKALSAARRARQIFERNLDSDPDSDDRRHWFGNNELELGRLLWATDRHAEAQTPWLRSLTIYKDLAQRAPNEPSFQIRLADTLVYLARWQSHFGDREEAERLVSRSEEAGRNLPDEDGVVYRAYEAPRWQGALFQCQAEIASDKGNLEQAIELLDKAIACQRRANELAPTDPWVKDFIGEHLRIRAATLIRAGRVDEAVKAVEDMVYRGGAFQSAHHHAAELLLLCADQVELASDNKDQVKKYRTRAHELVEKAHTVRNRSTVSQDHFAWFLLTCPDKSFRDPERALKLVKSVTMTVPDRLRAWRTLSLAHYRLGQWDDAEQALQPLLVAGSEESFDATTLYLRAMIEWQLGDRAQASRTFELATSRSAANNSHSTTSDPLAAEAASLLKASVIESQQPGT